MSNIAAFEKLLNDVLSETKAKYFGQPHIDTRISNLKLGSAKAVLSLSTEFNVLACSVPKGDPTTLPASAKEDWLTKNCSPNIETFKAAWQKIRDAGIEKAGDIRVTIAEQTFEHLDSCVSCNDNGNIHVPKQKIDPMPCHNCEGSGKTRHPMWYKATMFEEIEWKSSRHSKCLRCNGTGDEPGSASWTEEYWRMCVKCGGRGEVLTYHRNSISVVPVIKAAFVSKPPSWVMDEIKWTGLANFLKRLHPNSESADAKGLTITNSYDIEYWVADCVTQDQQHETQFLKFTKEGIKISSVNSALDPYARQLANQINAGSQGKDVIQTFETPAAKTIIKMWSRNKSGKIENPFTLFGSVSDAAFSELYTALRNYTNNTRTQSPPLRAASVLSMTLMFYGFLTAPFAYAYFSGEAVPNTLMTSLLFVEGATLDAMLWLISIAFPLLAGIIPMAFIRLLFSTRRPKKLTTSIMFFIVGALATGTLIVTLYIFYAENNFYYKLVTLPQTNLWAELGLIAFLSGILAARK